MRKRCVHYTLEGCQTCQATSDMRSHTRMCIFFKRQYAPDWSSSIRAPEDFLVVARASSICMQSLKQYESVLSQHSAVLRGTLRSSFRDSSCCGIAAA